MPGPEFFDTAIRFTAVLRKKAPTTSRPRIRGASAVAVWGAIEGEATAEEIHVATGINAPNIRRILRDFRDQIGRAHV